MGVRRAETAAMAAAESAAKAAAKAVAKAPAVSRVYTLGPLIHNPRVLADLKKRGVVEYPEELPVTNQSSPINTEGCSFIICAHGIHPRIENDLRGRGARIIDATCPRVKASQLKAESLSLAGYCLFLAGEAHHAEIAGILGYAAGFCEVVGSGGEAESAAKKLHKADKNAKAALIGQTTISEEEYAVIGEAIKKYFPVLEIIKTICSATKDRQQALRDLLSKVDAVLVAGGKDSANTRRLLAIAAESGKPCALIESAGEIPAVFKTFGTVGLCAGASTPDIVIDEIEQGLLH